MLKRYWLFFLWLFLGVAVKAQENAPVDIRELARKITIADRGQDAYARFVKHEDELAKQAERDNPPKPRDQFLNDKLVELRPDPKNIKSLKRLVAWIALYAEWNETLPSAVTNNLKPYQAELEKMSKNFSWDELSKRILEEEAKLKGGR